VARVVSSAEVLVALWSLHAPTRLADALVLSSVPVATSLVASSIPSQVGVQEGAQAFICSALGFDPALGLVLVLLQRLRQLAFVPLTLLLHLVARVVSSAEVLVALWSLHAPTRLADAVVLSSVPIATSLVASSIPSQVGVQEGAQAFVCSALGFDPALGLVLVLLQRLRQLAFVPLTLLLLSAAHPRKAPRAAPGDVEDPAV